MDQQTRSQPVPRSPILYGWLAAVVLVILCMALGAYISYPEWKGPHRSITGVADLDGDGDLDVVVGHTRWEAVSNSWAGILLWINQGGGKFTRQELHGGYAAAAGDVDSDGDPDILLLDQDGAFHGFNLGGAQRGQAGEFWVNNPIRPSSAWSGHADMGGSVLLGDLNGDGELDGFVAGCCYGWTGELPSDPNSLIPSQSWMWINEWDPPEGLVDHISTFPELEGLPIPGADLGDVDGDGDLDVFAAVGKPSLGKTSSLADRILLNDGSGSFTDSGQRLGDTGSTSAALGDLDGDGDLDALVGTLQGAVVWTNQGRAQGGQEGRFVPPGEEISGGDLRAVFLSDLDLDGDLDALIAGSRQAVLWWNDGRSALSPSNLRFRHSERQGLAIGDFDGDGSPDIFAAGDTDAYQVWFNRGDGRFRGR